MLVYSNRSKVNTKLGSAFYDHNYSHNNESALHICIVCSFVQMTRPLQVKPAGTDARSGVCVCVFLYNYVYIYCVCFIYMYKYSMCVCECVYRAELNSSE